MKKWTIGVDVGGTEVKFGLFDDKLQEKWSIPTNIQDKGAHILPEIAESVVERCRASGIHKEDLAGIGIGLPGPVLGGNIVKGCVNLGWAEIPVADELSRLLEAAFEQKEGNSSASVGMGTVIPVQAANDANVAALGEMWLGGGKNCTSLVMVTLGTGVGGGIVTDGHILDGVGGCAGEIGISSVWKRKILSEAAIAEIGDVWNRLLRQREL